jgi:hypothetical protein
MQWVVVMQARFQTVLAFYFGYNSQNTKQTKTRKCLYSTEKTKTNPRPRLAVHARIFSIQQTLLENDASNERLFVRVQWSDGDVLPVYTRAATMLRDIETLRKHRSSYKNARVTIQSVKIVDGFFATCVQARPLM